MPKILVVTQCCKGKDDSIELFPDISYSVLSMLSDKYRSKLEAGRRFFSNRVFGSRSVSALSMYVGHEYSVLDKKLIYRKFLDETIDFIIISAGYGLVHAFEKIRKYEAVMDNSTLSIWMRYGLPSILANYIISARPATVYGFFTRTSNYNRVFIEAAKMLPKTLETSVYIVNPVNCRGTSVILKSLGEAINSLIKYYTIPKTIQKCTINTDNITWF